VGAYGPPTEVKWIVDITCVMKDATGKSHNWIMGDVNYIPNGRFNLFSITKPLLDGWILHGSHPDGLVLTKGDQVIKFGHTICTRKGSLYILKLKRRETSK
jgi:hypothetical protein